MQIELGTSYEIDARKNELHVENATNYLTFQNKFPPTPHGYLSTFKVQVRWLASRVANKKTQIAERKC
ncbi:hypothetical protein OUZ56_014612 [Daphnia magna]|uniref:Uncharacterized protein n=1 Tax=Daphnia magna TaxID=35525 RepID=A0ABR0AKA0_9CRUS|nr:hypothetical protein OUZ56_014612 [Daphnia magna]